MFKSVTCFLSRITAGEALTFVMHLVSYRGSWKHRLSHAQRYRFLLDQMWGLDCYGRYLSRELSGITTSHFAYGVQLWVNSLIPLTGKQYKMKEHREKSPVQGEIPSLSLSYLLHNSMSKELFGKALKCKNKKQEERRKNKLNRKKWKGNLLTVEMSA